jgi:hypothetical protein
MYDGEGRGGLYLVTTRQVGETFRGVINSTEYCMY